MKRSKKTKKKRSAKPRTPAVTIRLNEMDPIVRLEAKRIGLDVGPYVRAVLRKHFGMPHPEVPFSDHRLVLCCHKCGDLLDKKEAQRAKPDPLHGTCFDCVPRAA